MTDPNTMTTMSEAMTAIITTNFLLMFFLFEIWSVTRKEKKNTIRKHTRPKEKKNNNFKRKGKEALSTTSVFDLIVSKYFHTWQRLK